MPLPETGWKQAWQSKGFRFQFILVLFVIAGLAAVIPTFFDFLESRNGPILPDPLLELFPQRDVSWLIFFILYSGVAIGLYMNLKRPLYLLLTLHVYALIMLMRVVTLTSLPLNPPLG